MISTDEKMAHRTRYPAESTNVLEGTAITIMNDLRKEVVRMGLQEVTLKYTSAGERVDGAEMAALEERLNITDRRIQGIVEYNERTK